MKQIEVKVTTVPSPRDGAGGTTLLIECSACGPVSVGRDPGAGIAHLLNVHRLTPKVHQ